MSYVYLLLAAGVFFYFLQENLFFHTEELFIGLVSFAFFSIIFFFLRKMINKYFFYRYDLVYTVFFFLLSLTNIYFSILKNLIIWLNLRFYVFDNYLIRMIHLFLSHVSNSGLKSIDNFKFIYLEVLKTRNKQLSASEGVNIAKSLSLNF